MRTIRYLSMLVVLLCSVTAWGQDDNDFDPPGPPEPGEPVLPVDPDEPDTPTYTLTLQATDGGSIKSGSGKYEEGTEVVVEANAPATNYIFIGWNNEQGETISTTLSFTYIMPQRDVTLTAVYDFNPGSPSEPSEPNISDGPGSTDTQTLYELKLIAEEGGSITAGAGKYEENEVVTVTASAAATNFVFTGWTDSSGATVSEERSFEFTMPAHDETLTAHYDFQPGSPSEPSEPDIPEIVDPDPIPTHILTVETEEGGTVQVNGTSVNGKGEFTLEEGSEVTITTTLSTNFVFDGWYSADTLYSANKNFTFNMGISDMSLKARFSFDPNAPSEPEVPETTNSEIYLMSVVGLPGETINYPLYLNSNDTISNIQFNIQFPKMMNVDLDGVSISPEAKGYAYAHKFLGTQEDNSEEFNTYEITLTGGTTPPGNTALLIFPVTIDENIERGRFRVWVNQVIMTTTEGTEVNASVRNGAINTDYVEPDTYAYLDNLISVGSSTYSTTQAQQISHLEPFTVEVPADSISHILGCSDVSFMTFKGLESYRKITDEQTAENGFWYGKDDYVRSYVADPSVMGMAVQYNPDTHIMSIMQYPGAYEVGDADTVKVYFTYKYKYYEVELRLNINRADILIDLKDELLNVMYLANDARERIMNCYEMTSASPIKELEPLCDYLMANADNYLYEIENIDDNEEFNLTEFYNQVREFIEFAHYTVNDIYVQIEAYTNAFESLMNMIAKLDYAIDDVQGKVPQALIDEAKEFEYFVRDAQPSFVLEEYANAEAKIAYMIDNLYASIQTEEVTVDNEVAGELDESVPVPEDVVILRVSGPLNGTDIKFIRENMQKLQVLDMHEAWIVSGGEAYLDDLHTSDLTIGDRMFAGLPTLTDIVLCDSIGSIGTDVLNGTLNVSTIAVPAMTQNVAAGMLNGTKKDIKVEWNSTVAVVPSLLNGNPNLIVYAVDGVKGEKDWQNIVRNGKIESIVLRDDYAFCIPEAFTANKVQYSRKFTNQAGPNAAGGWESIVLPFDVKSIKHRSTGRTLLPFGNTDSCDARFWLASLQQNGFTASASIDANTPYIIRMPNSIEYDDDANVSGVVVFSAESEDGVVMHATSEATAAQGDGYELVPSYDLVEPSTTVYVLNGNQYEEYMPGSIFVREEFGVKPFEAYVTVQDEDLSNSKFISIFENIDGIEEIKADIDNNRSIYDLYGRRIDKASMKSGNIYIINGKKLLYKVKG